jgi:hypothetical protein
MTTFTDYINTCLKELHSGNYNSLDDYIDQYTFEIKEITPKITQWFLDPIFIDTMNEMFFEGVDTILGLINVTIEQSIVNQYNSENL